MIGPGTGVAPFRGFIQERSKMKKEGTIFVDISNARFKWCLLIWLMSISGKPVGETILFFGCRKRAEDFLYEEELQEYVDDGLLNVIQFFLLNLNLKIFLL